MTAQIIPFQTETDRLWERYTALLRMTDESTDLRYNRQHIEQTLRAWKAFRDAFLADEQ